MRSDLIFPLLVTYQLKHYVADFLLQGRYMLGKFKPNWDFLLPLLSHVGVHAGFTFLISWCAGASPAQAAALAAFDGMIHFAMDRVKAGPKYMGRWKTLTATEFLEAQRVANAPLTFDALSGKAARKRLLGNTLFWFSLGLDQMVHALTHYAIIWYLVSR